MRPALTAAVAAELATPVPDGVRAFAEHLAGPGVVAVLFYGSILRTGDLSGVLDFYVLTEAPHRRGLRGLVERGLWPEVSFRQARLGGADLAAKIATLPLAVFGRAARGETLDTTIWARFVQPCALVWSRDAATAQAVTDAVAAAAVTAARYAAAVGPARGQAEDYWAALFRQTYAAEFRVEPPGRERQILAFHPGRYEARLPLAWRAGGVAFAEVDGGFAPALSGVERARLLAGWRRRRRMGKPLNLARLAKATFTFEGAARYAAWKIERHTGEPVAMTPWRERHPILAAPAMALSLWRAKKRRG